MIGLALGGLLRKKGRNTLTMLGVFIGVFALTMIISLGQGLMEVITGTVSGDDNLRQISLLPGFGIKQNDKPEEITIEGDMSDRRRDRLRRAAIARSQLRQTASGQSLRLSEESFAELRKIKHVQSIKPLILRRYQVDFEGHHSDGTQTFGVDYARRHPEGRVIAGRYPSANDANEVMVHEYLLYTWGYVTEAQAAGVVGKTLTIASVKGSGEDSPIQMGETSAADLQAAFKDMKLSDEEMAAVITLSKRLPEIMAKLRGGDQRKGKAITRELKIVGVLREPEAGDRFNLLEDGQSSQADLFFPEGLADNLLREAAGGGELTYQRALVMVDDPANAEDVEQKLRDKGYTAFSVASVLKRLESSLTVVTVILSFLTGIALIVATLGIVNTMITSVIERTREIGVWKAVGATNTQVQLVFLIESALIGLIGGLLGLGVAALAMIPGDMIARNLIAQRTSLPFDGAVFIMPIWLQVTGPILGTLVAVLAAIYPAMRASRVDPVTALRHD
jgi:putative ABC transport system permease protein